MADQRAVSYRLNLNRMKTQKWQTASKVDYGGDDWGENEYDDYEQTPPLPSVPQSASAAGSRQPAWESSGITPAQRSFTNPAVSPRPDNNRRSFDEGDESHHPISNERGLDMRQPTNPLESSLGQSQIPNQMGHRNQPSLQLDTHPQPPYTDTRTTPAVSTGLGAKGTERSMVAEPVGHVSLDHSTVQRSPITEDEESKPLPFIRPAQIYKRMEEEQARLRRSQESSRSDAEQFQRSGGQNPPLVAEAVHDVPASRISSSTAIVSPSVSSPLNVSTSTKKPVEPLGSSTGATYDNTSSSFSAPSRGIKTFSIVSDHEPDSLPQFENSVPRTQSIKVSSAPDPSDLEHKPSLGYKSMVHKAFDDESHDTSSPSTTTESLLRSNSASTSEISPIIGRRSDASLNNARVTGVQSETITEEPFTMRGRPDSTSTVTPRQMQPQNDSFEPPVVPPGFRRDSNTPSPGNSPARRPLSMATPPLREPDQGVLLTAPVRTSTTDTESVTTPIAARPAQATQEGTTVAAPTQLDRVDSVPQSEPEDWENWDEHNSFHFRTGSERKNSASPAAASRITRNESPAKGKVREYANKIESLSGRSTPSVSVDRVPVPVVQRPGQSLRLESFRPTLPGGWQSESTIGSLDREEANAISTPPRALGMTRMDSTDSIPTATAPRGHNTYVSGPVEAAFAAAAAAGTAMAGAFSGHDTTQDTSTETESDSEHEPYPGGFVSSPPIRSSTRDFASQPLSKSSSSAGHPESSPTADTLAEQRESHAPTTDENQSPVDYPAPLRTARTADRDTTSSRLSTFNPIDDPIGQDAEQLQQDIVKSLTPKSSANNIDENTQHQPQAADSGPLVSQSPRYDTIPNYDAEFSREHSSYQPNTLSRRQTIHEQVTNIDSSSRTAASKPRSVPVAAAVEPVAHEDVPIDRPRLDQKFSWEEAPARTIVQPSITPTIQNKPSERATAQSSMVPNVPIVPVVQSKVNERTDVQPSILPYMQDKTNERTETPTARRGSIIDQTASRSPPNPPDQRGLDSPASSIPSQPSTIHASTANASAIGSISQPTQATDFKSIMAYQDPYQRIRAFEDNRRIHTEPNGLLNAWLTAMNVPEHAEVFVTSRQSRTQAPAYQGEQTPPRREATGTKQIQEDGKRLLAVAGKYGGKAGSAAKGLFARGKDRLRTASGTVSAGDKVPVTNRRRSTIDESSIPSSPQSQRSTMPPSTAPQIPTPTPITPVEEVSWSLISSTINDLFTNDPSSPPSKTSSFRDQRLSQMGIRGEVTRQSVKDIDGGTAPRVKSDMPVITSAKVPASKPGPPLHIAETSFLADSSPDTQPDSREDTLTSAVYSAKKQSPTQKRTLKPLPVPPANVVSQQPVNAGVHQRRPSSVSAVSEMSREHETDEAENALARNISPPPDEVSSARSQEVPIFLSRASEKEAEAHRERESKGRSSVRGSLPPYSSPIDRTDLQARIIPGTQIVPIADLKGSRIVDHRASARPFSFMGTEASAPSYRTTNSPPPITPVDVPQSRRAQLDEKSLEPNILEHPAYRRSSEIRRGENTSNPLPSSRRPTEDIQKVRAPPKPATKEDEPQGSYRIPGPYVQEYRPPKPKASTEQFRYRQSPSSSEQLRHMQSPGSAEQLRSKQPRLTPEIDQLRQSPSQAEAQMQRPAPEDDIVQPHTYVNLPQHNKMEKSQGLSLGGLLRTRSASRGREDRHEPAAYGSSNDERKKRRVLFKFGSSSRSDIPTLSNNSQASNGYGNSYAAQGYHGRKMSGDMFKSNKLNMSSPPDRKKNRMSGLANLFTRSNKDKGRSTSNMEHRSDVDLSSAGRVPSAQSLRHIASSAPPTGYLGPDRSAHESFSPASCSPYGPPQTPHSDGRLGSMNSTMNEQARQKAWFNRSEDIERPENLRVDTKTGVHPSPGRSGSTTPFTASSTLATSGNPTQAANFSSPTHIPLTYAPRDISYGQDTPYQPPITSPPKRGAANGPNMEDHVKNLHKRARSPRLGRPSSDEFLRRPFTDAPDAPSTEPVTRLGMFNKKASPVGGLRSAEDQEKPWLLSLPGGGEPDEDEYRNPREGHSRHDSIQQSPIGHLDRSSEQQGRAPIPDRQDQAWPLPEKSITTSIPTSKPQDFVPSKRSDARTASPTTQQGTTPPKRTVDVMSAAKDSQLSKKAHKSSEPQGERTPSPYQSETDMPGKGPAQPRDNTTPNVTYAANTSRPYTITNPVTKVPAGPKTTTTVGDTITTTTTMSSGPRGFDTQMKTIIEPPKNQGVPSAPYQTQAEGPQERYSSTGGRYYANLQQDSTSATNPGLPPIAAHTSVVPSLAVGNGKNHEQQVSKTPSPDLPADSPLVAIAPSKESAPSKIDGSSHLKSFAPVELPGSKPEGYESDEEPIMSATAGPGQDWMPEYEPWEM